VDAAGLVGAKVGRTQMRAFRVDALMCPQLAVLAWLEDARMFAIGDDDP
jgi:hypothetical protein